MDTPSSSKILISEERIQHRVIELAKQISADYVDQPVTLLGVMTGSLLFLADLMKHLEIPHQIGVLQASSYSGKNTRPGELTVNLDFLPALKSRHVLLIDDILDTGQTVKELLKQLRDHEPLTLKTLVLLWKKERTQPGLRPDYAGFEIEDRFVIGYGLDFDDNFRHLPDICELDPQRFK